MSNQAAAEAAPAADEPFDLVDLMEHVDMDAIGEMTEGIMLEGYVPQDFTEITDDELEAVYATGIQLIDSGQFDKAEKAFMFLGYMNHYEAKYWLGLGVARQMQGKHAEALTAYSPACLHDAGNPVPPLRSAECHLAVGDVETAEACLHVCLEWCGDSGQYSGVRDRANLLLETVNRKKGG